MDKQKEKQKYLKIVRQNNGITLIALVITIIVLLILAGVALATLTGNSSIIENANNAVERYNASANGDQEVLNQVENLFAKYMGEGVNSDTTGDDDTTDDDDDDTPAPSVDANGYATAPYTVVADETNNIQIVIPTGFAPAILNTTTNATSSAPGEDGSIKSVMPAANWSNITAAQINAGVVIKNAAGEEFVWVPIPNSSNFARTAWTTAYGHDSSGIWVNGTGVTQTLAEISTANAFWEATSSTEYTNMINSVNTNKGFYISRYEASNNGSSVAQSKRGISPWVNVTQTTAITASSNNSISNTHLMYGIEWDSVLNWLIGKATIGSSTSGQTKTMESADITDSRSWGNYSNSTGDAATNSGDLRTTTHNENWKANNIYDLAGNVYEWTQEKYSTGADRAFRGGSCENRGERNPAASRDLYDGTDTLNIGRFPFQLLLVALDSGSDAV